MSCYPTFDKLDELLEEAEKGGGIATMDQLREIREDVAAIKERLSRLEEQLRR